MGELSERDFERIERFILDRMDSEEHKAFQREMETDEDLRQAVVEQSELIKSIEAEGLKAELDSIHSELYAMGKKKKSPFLLLSIAASLAVLVGFSFWYFNLGDESSDLYAEYSYTDPGLPVPMSASDNYDFYDAMVDYKTEDYHEAIHKWGVLLDAEPQNDTLIYYIGASYFNMDSLDLAQSYLKEISNSTDSKFIYKARYMLFLSELKKGNTEAVLNFEPMKDSPFKTEIKAAQESLRS